MATILGKLSTILSLNSAGFTSGMNKAQGTLASFKAGVESSVGSVTSLVTQMAAAGTAALGIGGIGVGLKLAADAEQAQVAFGVMLGSAERAKVLIADLNRFAAATPFEFPGLRDAAKSLLAFGVAQKDIIPSLTAIGDIAAGIGAPIEELAELYGKAKVQGRLFAQDVNQLTGRGIPVIQEFAKQFGVAESEVRGLVESGQINFANLEQAFVSLTSQGGKFAGLMEAQSRTLGGLFSTLKDTIGAALREIGEAIVKHFDLKQVVEKAIALGSVIKESIVPAIASAASWLSEWGAGIVKTIAGIVAFVAALKAIAIAQRAIATAQAIVLALSGPKGWALLAAGAVVAATAVMGVSQAFASVENAALQAKTAAVEAADAAKQTGQAAGPILQAGQAQQKLASFSEQAIAKIKEETKAIGVSADELLLWDMAAKGADRYQIALARLAMAERDKAKQAVAAKEAASEQAKANQELIDRLKEQRATLGLTAAQLDEWKLRQNGATDEQIKQARELHETIDSINERRKADDKLKDSAARVLEETRTPFERFEQRIQELQDLSLAGAIDEELFNRAAMKAKDELIQADQQPDFDPAVSALERGSAAAFSAVNRQRNNPQNKLEDLTKRQLDADLRIEKTLQQIRDKTAAPPQEVDPF